MTKQTDSGTSSSSARRLLLALAVGSCLLLPAAMAHNTTGGRAGGLPNGVSGNYVGPSGPAVVDSLTATYIAPFYAMVCDLESEETVVDGTYNPAGWVSDGTWDDGGYGGACHTSTGGAPGFNTFGCLGGYQAYAADATGGNVFLAAACDWKEDLGGGSTGLTLSFCLANNALALNPGPSTLVAGSLAVVQCGLDAVACALNPACGATGSVQICGADGVIDAANYGYGGGLFTTFSAAIFPASPNSVVNGNPPVTTNCAGLEVAAVYVLSAVDTYSGIPKVSTPTTGWIDSGTPCSGCSFTWGVESRDPIQLPPIQPPQSRPAQSMGHG